MMVLYDDKLSGEIAPSNYKEKHDAFVSQKTELLTQLDSVDKTAGKELGAGSPSWNCPKKPPKSTQKRHQNKAPHNFQIVQ